jgi:hypothetical protein
VTSAIASRSGSTIDRLRPRDAPPVPHRRRGRFPILARDGAPEPNLVCCQVADHNDRSMITNFDPLSPTAPAEVAP